MRHLLGLCLSLGIGLVVSPCLSAAPQVDPALAGIWQSTVPMPGVSMMMWEISPQGQYRLFSTGTAGTHEETGTMVTDGRTWQTTPSSGQTERGEYKLLNAKTMSVTRDGKNIVFKRQSTNTSFYRPEVDPPPPVLSAEERFLELAKRKTERSTAIDVKDYKEGFRTLEKEGLNALDGRKYQEALVYFDQIVDSYPFIASGYFYRGVIQQRLGKHAKAIKDYTESLRLHPLQPEAYYNRGLANKGIKEDRRGQQDIDHALRLNPSLPRQSVPFEHNMSGT